MTLTLQLTSSLYFWSLFTKLLWISEQLFEFINYSFVHIFLLCYPCLQAIPLNVLMFSFPMLFDPPEFSLTLILSWYWVSFVSLSSDFPAKSNRVSRSSAVAWLAEPTLLHWIKRRCFASILEVRNLPAWGSASRHAQICLGSRQCFTENISETLFIT